MTTSGNSIKNPTLLQALIPVVFLMVFITFNVRLFEDTLSGANQIALILASAIAGVIAVSLGHKWLDVRAKAIDSISSAMPSILILFLIGSLAGTWMISGVVPMLIYYGLQILNPKIFLFATVIICAMVSLATGSSWSTVATIGVALLGIGITLGIKAGLVAGAIISGAYFGDKMSPLSDTTNLAPAMAGTDLFTHVKYMLQTALPALLISLVIFLVLGFTIDFEAAQTDVTAVLSAIKETYYISPVLLLVPALLIVVIIRKVPPLPSLLFGTLLAAVFAVIFQPKIISMVAESLSGSGENPGSYLRQSYIAIMGSMFGSVSVVTENETVNDLLSTGGMAGMLNTVWLILTAMVFGGIMEAAGLLMKITQYIMKLVHNAGSLVGSTIATCIFFNLTASDQYLAIVVPGRMFSKLYRDMGYKPELLSRSLEGGGTVTSVLIPWNTCGATQSKVLGVPVWEYAPYAFFNLLSPLVNIFLAAFRIGIRTIPPDQLEEKPEQGIERSDV
ncbi:MAG: Na+/H+ antiporter NhaC [Bacteroidetes bacterium]|nr:Na+/H+ antiporter NhaC [Bacteroidota bacterium]